MQIPGRLAGKERSFPALDDALQLAECRHSAASHMQQDEDSLLRSQWSIQALPDLTSKKQDFELLKRWLSVSSCSPSDDDLHSPSLPSFARTSRDMTNPRPEFLQCALSQYNVNVSLL